MVRNKNRVDLCCNAVNLDFKFTVVAMKFFRIMRNGDYGLAAVNCLSTYSTYSVLSQYCTQ